MMRRPLTNGQRRSVKWLRVYGNATPIFDTMKLGKTLSWHKGFPRKFWAKTRPLPSGSTQSRSRLGRVSNKGSCLSRSKHLRDHQINSFEVSASPSFLVSPSHLISLAELRMKTSSEVTCIPAASKGFKRPRKARVTPMPSTVTVP